MAVARRAARRLCELGGFNHLDGERVALAVTELGTNLHRYAQRGVLTLGLLEDAGERRCLRVASTDGGPGIEDLETALADGRTRAGSLGGGLPGVRRLMDDFSIVSSAGGTTIVALKWTPLRG